MNGDEDNFQKKLQRFSVVRQCPRCKKLSLSFKNNSISCENCGFEEKMPAAR